MFPQQHVFHWKINILPVSHFFPGVKNSEIFVQDGKKIANVYLYIILSGKKSQDRNQHSRWAGLLKLMEVLKLLIINIILKPTNILLGLQYCDYLKSKLEVTDPVSSQQSFLFYNSAHSVKLKQGRRGH